jgi:glutamate-5-semialdehyde dehydrogenase
MATAAATDLSVRSRAAARVLAGLDRPQKDAALHAIADAIVADGDAILAANADDVAAARSGGTSAALLDRLTLTQGRLATLAEAARAVAALPDPCGEVVEGFRLGNGVEVTRVRVPLGRVLVVYEARPNVTVDVAALCLKAGNVALLRGSSSARRTNAALLAAVHRGLGQGGVTRDAVLALELDRTELAEAVANPGTAEVVIPRGGEGLKDFLLEHARIPVLAAAGGNCHVYVDATADPAMARRIVVNAKTQRPGVCNAAETLLVNRERLDDLQGLLAALHDHGVELRGCPRTVAVAGEVPVVPASDDDYATEFLDLVLAVRVVDSLDEAIDHIARYSTGHSEAIVTSAVESADRFCREVDSACVYVNASTRFTDGGEFGMGAEIGNSTARLHARGPIGLRDITTTKYIGRGAGQIRE